MGVAFPLVSHPLPQIQEEERELGNNGINHLSLTIDPSHPDQLHKYHQKQNCIVGKNLLENERNYRICLTTFIV